MAVAGAELVCDELAVLGQPGAHAGLAGKPPWVPLDVQKQAAALLLSSRIDKANEDRTSGSGQSTRTIDACGQHHPWGY